MKWTLKSKILIGLGILLIFSISFNLFYSYQLIVKDKTAYIFENGLDKVESLADQTVETIQKHVDRSSAFILLAEKSPEDFKSLLSSDRELLFFGYRYKGGDEWRTFTSTRQLDSGKKYSKEVEEIFNKSSKQFSNITHQSHDINGLLVLALHAKSKDGEVFFIFDLEKIKTLFQEDNVFNNNLLNLNLNNLIDPTKQTPNYLKELVEAKGPKGTKILETKEGQLLASFAKFPALDIFVTGTIKRDKAFVVVDDLINRSIFFGMILLGFSMLAGVFFSRQITSPIQHLVEATGWIANGEFNKSVDIQSNDELKILGESFNYMSDEINTLLEQKQDMIKQLEDSNLKLEDYSKNLEKMVEERTSDLQSANDFIGAMINSLDQGLLVIDKDLNCNDIYTKACEDLFSTSPKDQTFGKVLGKTEKEEKGMMSWANILFSEKIPFESAIGLGPKNYVVGESVQDENFKHVDISYYPMRNNENEITNVVAVATDKTDEMKAIEAFNEKEAYVGMILKLVHSKKNFMGFIDEAKNMFSELETALNLDVPDINHAMLMYHSLNGGFGTYSVASLQNLARVCEQRIVDIKSNEGSIANEKVNLLFDFDNFKETFKSFLVEIDSLFASSKGKMEIDKALVLYVGESIRNSSDINEIRKLFIDYIEREAIEHQFKGYAELVQDLSLKFNKPMAPVKFTNGELRIEPEKHNEFFSSLVHLFRNCFDHGIEDLEKRKERNKPDDGQISVAFKYEGQNGNQNLHVTVSDDGGGIDPKRIREKLLENNKDEDVSKISDQDIIYRIFDQDFSTAEELTSVSGRGVGMSAIKDVLEKNGGRLSINSEVGVGTTFDFWIPTS